MWFSLARWRNQEFEQKAAYYLTEAQRCSAAAESALDDATKQAAKSEEAYWLRLAEELNRDAEAAING